MEDTERQAREIACEFGQAIAEAGLATRVRLLNRVSKDMKEFSETAASVNAGKACVWLMTFADTLASYSERCRRGMI